MEIRKAYKFRIYPNKTQQAELAKQFGAARFVYNHYRRVREEYYQETGTGLTYRDCADDLADRLKVEHPWLKEADSQVLQQVLKDLDTAYGRFFKKLADYPNFKCKHSNQGIRYPQRFKLSDKRIYLPKIGWVKAIFHRDMEGEAKNCTVTKTKSGRYFVSIQCEVEIERVPSGREPKQPSVGVDVGLKSFAVLSTGEKIDAPQFLRKSERLLKIRQRRLSRKVKGGNNRSKARHRVAIQHERVANQRKDFHHKISRQLVNDFGLIAVEDLNVRGMMANHHLAKSIADAGWRQFTDFCAYKQAWAGGQLVRNDRWHASTKTCSDCGAVNHSLKLSDRSWVCVSCGSIHDRDENAAKNHLNKATVGITESHAYELRASQ